MEENLKQLLMKDLCGRLPYKVKALFPDLQGGYTSVVEEIDLDGYVKDFEGCQNEICDIKPYLFPLSSMTEEQDKIYGVSYEEDFKASRENLKKQLDGIETINGIPQYHHIDWLNAHHFDYRGLIPKGLAIDATGLRIYD